jgi:cytosine/adenosine deaminase-related metal-dependent hydrolase
VTVYRADWVLPIAADPIPDGWLAIQGGRITACGAVAPAGAIDLGRVAIMPSLVNAHTHLELSHLLGRVPPAHRFTDWIRPLMALRRQYPDPEAPEILAAAEAAIAASRASGTGLVGDVTNTLVTLPLLRGAGMPARVFHELLGFNLPEPEKRVADARERLRDLSLSHDSPISIAPHAPYSVSPELFAAIRADVDATPSGITSVHLGESAEELELLQRGTGDMRDVLEELGAWNPGWRPPGVSPVRYLQDLGFLDSRVLAVHGVQFSGDDLDHLRALGVTVISCPRSNVYVGVGEPPIEAFYAMGVSVAFGTDSLASAGDLSMFSELATARRLAPRVPAGDLLKSATLCGARALGFGDMGCIEPGQRASLIAVRMPGRSTGPLRDRDDVEEYLVSGIEPDAITWLDAELPTPNAPTPEEERLGDWDSGVGR